MENDILLKAYVIGLIGGFCGCWLFAAIYNIVHDIIFGRRIKVKIDRALEDFDKEKEEKK